MKKQNSIATALEQLLGGDIIFGRNRKQKDGNKICCLIDKNKNRIRDTSGVFVFYMFFRDDEMPFFGGVDSSLFYCSTEKESAAAAAQEFCQFLYPPGKRSIGRDVV